MLSSGALAPPAVAQDDAETIAEAKQLVASGDVSGAVALLGRAAEGAVEAGALAAAARCYAEVAEIERQRARYADALSASGEALDLRRRLHSGDHVDVAASLSQSGQLLYMTGKGREALTRNAEALKMWRRLLDGDDERVARSMTDVADCVRALGDSDRALPLYEAALNMRERLGDLQKIAWARNNLAACLQSLGRHEDALPQLEDALAKCQQWAGGDHLNVAMAQYNLGQCLRALGRSADAQAHLEAALAMSKRLLRGDHPRVADGMVALANCLIDRGRASEALPMLRDGLAMFRRVHGGDHPDVARGWNDLASCLERLGRTQQALAAYENALAIWRRCRPSDHPDVAVALSNSAGCLLTLGREEEALSRYEEALGIWRGRYRGDHPDLAAGHSNVAGALQSLGRSDEARAEYETALAMARRLYSGEHPLVASCSTGLATALVDLGRAREALPLLEDALATQRALHDGDHPDLAKSLNWMAVILRLLAKHEDALRSAEEALAMRRRIYGERHPVVATTLMSTAECLITLGRRREALSRYEMALAILREARTGDHHEIATALCGVGACLDLMGRSAEALPLLESALAMSRRLHPGDHDDVVVQLAGVAGCLRSLGRITEAFPKQAMALAMCRRLYQGDHPRVATLTSRLAGCLLELGRAREALPLAEESLAMHRRIHERDHPDTLTAITTVASCLMALGRPAEALPMTRTAVAMSRRLYEGDHPDLVSSLQNEAACLQLLGEHAAALPELERAMAMFARLFPETPEQGRQLINLGSCLKNLGRNAEALAKYEAARALYERLYPIDHVLRVWCLTLVGAFRLRTTDDTERAAAELERAIDMAERLRGVTRALETSDRSSYFAELRRPRPYRSMAEAQLRLGRVESALRYTERGRGRGLLDRLLEGAFDPLEDAARAAQRSGDDETVERIAELREQLADVRRETSRLFHAVAIAGSDRDGSPTTAERAERELEAAHRRQRQLARERARIIADRVPLSEPASSEQLRSMLSADDLLLYYVLSEERSFVFVLQREGELAAVDLPASDEEIADLASRFVAGLARSTPDDRGRPPGRRPTRAAARGLARALGRVLLPGAVWQRVSTARRVYVIPDGPLHLVPFEALEIRADAGSGEATSWLDAGPPISYAASGSALQWVLERAESRATDRGIAELVAFGDPIFARSDGAEAAEARPADAPRTRAASWAAEERRLERDAHRGRFGDLPRLPGTRQEIEAIARAFAGAERAGTPYRVTARLGSDATESALYELAGRARYLHLATHGIFDEVANASYSAVALTMPAEPTATDDGFLELRELFTRWSGRLSGCDMVVLSACRTKVGALQQDDAVQALPIGMLYAGASSVVASLWNVDDKSTALLMAEFYERIRDAPAARVDRCAALHAAKRALKKRFPDPFHWAPFVYIGSPR